MSRRAIALTCFFLSGSTGLIYEILWTRFLGGVIGNTHFSITVVVAVFMGGLGLGSYYGGRLADRTPNPLRLYGILVLAVGIACLLIPLAVEAGRPLFRWLYQFHEGDPEAGPALFVRILFCILLLLIPTSFMGATLPVLTRYFTRRLSELGGTIGGLYAVNTLGALVGATFTGFVGIQLIGLWGCNALAVGIDIAVGVLVLAVAESETPAQPAGSPPREPEPEPAATGAPSGTAAAAVRLAVFAFGVSGFANMLLQLAWTKAIVLTIGNSTYAFSLIVSLFILGIAVGGALASVVADRLKDPFRALGILFLLTGTWVAITIPLLGHFPILGARLFDRAGPEATYGTLLGIQIGLVSVIILPATTLMGTIFPLVGKIRTETLTAVGRSVGIVYFWNTMGSIIGTLVAGFVFIPWFGRVYYTLYLGAGLILLCGLGLVAITVRSAAPRRAGVLAATAALVVGPHLFFLPHGVLGSSSHLWHPSILSQGAYVSSNFRNAYDDARGNVIPTQEFIERIIENNQIVYYQEGIHAPVAVVTNATGAKAMRISGKVEASLAPEGGFNNDLPHQVMAGHLPMLLHPAPRDVLTLGLGGGVTLSTLVAHPVKSVDSLEISPEVVAAARDYFGKANRGAITNELVRNVVGDGRYHLEYTTRTYDVITSVPSNPWIAGIGNLFTTEFFELCKRKLRDEGIICNWIHKVNMRTDDLRTVVRTFVEVFDEHAQLWDLGYDCLLIGSKSPITIDAARLKELLAQEEVSKDLAGLGVDSPLTLLRHYKFDGPAMRKFADPGGIPGPLNTDSFPVLEYSCPFGLYGHTLDAFKGLVEAGYVPLDKTRVRNFPDEEMARAARLQQGFHQYLLGFIRERELTDAYAVNDAPLAERPDLLNSALQIIEDLKLMAHATEAGGGDPWLEGRASLLAIRALDIKKPRASLGGTLAEWFLQMAKLQPDRETGAPYVTQALELAHHDPTVSLQVADVAMRVGMSSEGLVMLARALTRHPKDARLFLAAGVLQRNRGQREQALMTLNRGLELAENHIVRSQLHCDLGLTHQSMRQFDQARLQYEQALEINPENQQAVQLLDNMERFLESGVPAG